MSDYQLRLPLDAAHFGATQTAAVSAHVGSDFGGGRHDGADGDPACRQGSDMIAAPAGVKILIATMPADVRRGADSLMALVRERLGHDPYSGTTFVLRSKRADCLKIESPRHLPINPINDVVGH